MVPLRRAKLSKNLPVDHRVNSYFMECHNHEYYEFVCVAKGRGINVINDTIQFFEPQCLMLIRPEDIHFVKKIDEFESTFEYFNIPVPKEIMDKEFENCEELREFVLNPPIPCRVKLSNTEVSVLTSKALQLKDMPVSAKRKYLYNKLIQCMCGTLIMNEILPDVKFSDWFSELLVKIENVNIEELTYDLMLSMANVSGKTLWKMFKKHLNVTPSEYISARRAETAYNMIVKSDKSFMDIAMQLNYGSYVQFYREMKKRFNLSPREISEMR